jgi:hypothetical protein
MGARLHTKLLEYLPYLDDGVLLEIGSDRGEGSTQFFAGLVYGTNRELYAVDPSDFVAANVMQYEPYIENFTFTQTTGENFLSTFDKRICYAYLDNYDYNSWEDSPKDTWEDWVVEMVNEYDNHSNAKCIQVHLQQAQMIDNLAADKCIIHFDDTYGNLDEFLLGKGAAAVPWLIENGWHTIDVSDEGGSWILANFDEAPNG